MAAIRRESALVRIELASIGSDKNFVDLTFSQRVASGFRGGLCNDPPDLLNLRRTRTELIREIRNNFAPYVQRAQRASRVPRIPARRRRGARPGGVTVS